MHRHEPITLKQADETVYHELGHFLAFVAGNIDTSAAFQQTLPEGEIQVYRIR